MTHDVTLYMFNESAPSLTARLMLEHKRIDHTCKHLMVGPHAFAMPPRGFEMMTVPAMRISGRPVQGSRVISRALDEIQFQPPLFPADPQRRQGGRRGRTARRGAAGRRAAHRALRRPA